MEPKLNCEIAAAALWDMIPSQGLPKDGLFSLHDPLDDMADQLVIGMSLPIVAVGDMGHVICGPLNPQQAAVLGVVGCMTNLALDVITPKPPAEYVDGGEAVLAAAGYHDTGLDLSGDDIDVFRAMLAEELGVSVDSIILTEDEGCAYLDLAGASTAAHSLDMEPVIGVAGQPELSNSGSVGLPGEGHGLLSIDEAIADLDGTAYDYAQDVHDDLAFALGRPCADLDPAMSVKSYLDHLSRDHGVPIYLDRENCIHVGDNAIYAEDRETPSNSPDFEPERSQILIDAAVTVTGARTNQYGEPEDSLAAIAAYWSVYFGADFTPKDVAVMMTLLKIARAENGYHRDNYVDAAGYLGLAGEAELNAVTTPTTTRSIN